MYSFCEGWGGIQLKKKKTPLCLLEDWSSEILFDCCKIPRSAKADHRRSKNPADPRSSGHQKRSWAVWSHGFSIMTRKNVLAVNPVHSSSDDLRPGQGYFGIIWGISMDSHYDTSESAAAARRSSRSTSLTRPCGISPSCITPSGCSPFCFLIPRRRRRFLLNWAGEQSCVHRCSRAEFVILLSLLCVRGIFTCCRHSWLWKSSPFLCIGVVLAARIWIFATPP